MIRARAEAVGSSRGAAWKRERGEMIIHRPDNVIRDRDSYGNDPFPPWDKN